MTYAHRRFTLAAGTAATLLLALSSCSAPQDQAGSADGADTSEAGPETVTSTRAPESSSAAGTTPPQTKAAQTGGKNDGNEAGIAPLGDANTEMKTARPEAPGELIVSDVRVGKHDDFDRVVFDLDGEGTPGWFVDYATTPTQQGSGNPVEYDGTIALNVNVDGTTYPFELGKDAPDIGTVKGGGDRVTEVISSGTFEGRSQFVVGLTEKRPYSVQVLDNPSRLVIDIS